MNYEKWNKIDLLIDMEEDPLKKYNYFKKIEFNKCNYIFIIPEHLSELFSSFYTQKLKDSLIFFPKDFQQAKELLNDYENEEGIKENWIIISPCVELVKNIKNFHENKNIYCFIGYCPIFNHEHNTDFLYKFPKYYGIVDSASELIERLFKLNYIVFYRKKQKYEINNNDETIEIKYDRNVLIDLKNEGSKNHVINEKLDKYFNFKMNSDNCFFGFIKSFTLINKCLEDENYTFLCNMMDKLGDIIIISDNPIQNKIISSVLFKNLHLLYLYFSNYPYFFGKLSDEEINAILSTFKPNMNKSDFESNTISGFNSLIKVVDDLANKVDKGMSILNENEKLEILHRLLIEINFSIDQLMAKINIQELSKFYQIKNYIRDIEFCLGKILLNIFCYYCKDYPLKFEITHPYINLEKRLSYYTVYSLNLQINNNIKDEQEKPLNKAIKYNDTIVIGEKNFQNLIKKMNLPCKNIYYLDVNQISDFFKNPKKIDNKYNICKYFIIINEKLGLEYLETIKYICNVYALKIVAIIYIQNKNVKIDKKILQVPIIPTILTYSEKDILNYYFDGYERLAERNIKGGNIFELLEQKIDYKFPKLSETKIIREQDNGWDMIRDVNVNIFKLVSMDRIFGYISIDIFVRDMYKVYEENNCLDLFIKYYANYFGEDYIIEQQSSMVAVVKMFLYAYTLDENNDKSFYLIMNKDLRSGNSLKISRYLFMIRSIYNLIKSNFLKSFSGDVYRATWFKQELIDEIKPGKKMLNASFWSSSKKLNVAEKFLFATKKNILLHTKVKEGNNIDIHLENLSKYPDEEEILFLPYCYFEVKSFKKVKKNGLEYHELELIYCDEENKSNKIENLKFNDIK